MSDLSKFDLLVRWHNETITFGSVIGLWSAQVLKMSADMREFPAEVVGNFGYDDFIDALFTRTYLESAAFELEIAQDDHEYYTIRASDELFRILTRDDPGLVVISSESMLEKHRADPNYWWIRRIPVGGALGYEVCRMARAVGGLKY